MTISKSDLLQLAKDLGISKIDSRTLSFRGQTTRSKIDLSGKEAHQVQLLADEFIEALPQKLFGMLLPILKAPVKEKEPVASLEEILGDVEFGGVDINLASLKVIFPLNSTRKDNLYFDCKENKLLNYVNPGFLDYVRSKVGSKPYQAWFQQAVTAVNVGFNPEQPKLVYEVEGSQGNKKSFFNLYKAPSWRYIEDTCSEPPEEFTHLLAHLFPSRASREIVERWIHDAIFYRAQTHLLLHGYKGTGKTSLAELCMYLVGEENSHAASSSQIDSNFDSSLLNTVLYFWDELNFSKPSAKNKLKKYINTKFAVDQKFVDSHAVSDIHASHIICNNLVTDCLLEIDDRVFTVPDISKKGLKTIWSDDKIDNFKKVLSKNDHFLAKIGYYLKRTYGGKGRCLPAKTFISQNYIELINHSISPYWKRATISLCYEQEIFSLSDVKEKTKDFLGRKSPVSHKKVMQLLEDYQSYLGVLLAKEYGDDGDVFQSLVYEEK